MRFVLCCAVRACVNGQHGGPRGYPKPTWLAVCSRWRPAQKRVFAVEAGEEVWRGAVRYICNDVCCCRGAW